MTLFLDYGCTVVVVVSFTVVIYQLCFYSGVGGVPVSFICTNSCLKFNNVYLLISPLSFMYLVLCYFASEWCRIVACVVF